MKMNITVSTIPLCCRVILQLIAVKNKTIYHELGKPFSVFNFFLLRCSLTLTHWKAFILATFVEDFVSNLGTEKMKTGLTQGSP